MKTIELNQYAALVLAVVIAGLGSILPSFFNLAGYMSGIVYLVVAVVLFSTYRAKVWYRVNTVDLPQKAAPGIKQFDSELAAKLRELNKELN